jgi:hypothetical protein
MRKVIILTAFLVLMASSAWAETYQFITPSESKEVKKEVTRKIEVVREKEYLTITIYPKDSKPVIYRVWPCGSVERQEWKEISANQERSGSSFATTATAIWSPANVSLITR